MINSGTTIKIALLLNLIFVGFPWLTFPQDSRIEIPVFETTENDSTLQDSIKIDVHPQDVSEEAGFFIKSSGTIGTLRIYGSVRLAGAYDLNGLTDANSFSTYDIPVGEDALTQARFFMVPNQTRLGFEVNRSSLIGPVKLKIETDFLGANNSLRIRHAYVESGNFIIGQTWSTFTDVNSVPSTVDIDGPNSSVILRTIRIRYADKVFTNNIKYIVSLETPDPDVSIADSLNDKIPSQFLPDIAGQLIHKYPFGYLSLSGIIRSITVKDSAESSDQILGVGVLFAGVYNLDNDNKLLFQGVFGRAISRFITALEGKGIDLVYNPGTETFEATQAFGLLGSYSHTWMSGVTSAFTVGMVGINNKDYEPPDAFSQSWYYSGNIFWNTTMSVRLGLEFSQGRRINKNGEFGKATRIGFIFYTDF